MLTGVIEGMSKTSPITKATCLLNITKKTLSQLLLSEILSLEFAPAQRRPRGTAADAGGGAGGGRLDPVKSGDLPPHPHPPESGNSTLQ